MILLVSQSSDEHADAVAARLTEMGAPYHRLAPMDLAGECYSINPLQPGFAADQPLRTHGPGAGIGRTYSAIWWRRPRALQDKLRLAFPLSDEISAAEAFHAFRFACETLPRSLFPLGHPLPMEQAGNKLLQLHVAQRVGFTVPATLVGNDPVAHRQFLEQHERVVVKPLFANVAYDKVNRGEVVQELWCRGLSAQTLLAHLTSDRPVQLMIQAAVAKVRDWRITVLPTQTFCCEIDSSSLPADEPDFRPKTMNLPHLMIPVSAEFDRQLRDFLRALDLPAGYFDFAVPADGMPVFLECNTNAQWLWIEQLTGVSISAEVARCLASASD
jgi:glutathione synthase/RimK-type ligase-like ATP-grasp enzyme